ncbi:thioredoxin family protein [uncultured Cytophaga sp.]|uniref:thioredoxin family protein n=1 Tax=uncultured Cytophaga sp. TaxID=160238 RepID=UPI00260A7E88|nr:thioredoxin family protein [uncultured Cytophaga sp.]
MKKIFLLILISASFITHAQTLSGYRIGDAIQNFTLLNVTNETPISLTDYNDKKVVVIIFVNNSCPYAKLYEQRIMNLAKQFNSSGVAFLLINSSVSKTDKQETIEAMRKKVQNDQSLYPYLADSTQRLAIDFGVTRLPDAFVLKKMENSFRLVYKGSIDDNPQSAKDVTYFFLSDAITAMITNKSIKVSESRPVGCLLKQF